MTGGQMSRFSTSKNRVSARRVTYSALDKAENSVTHRLGGSKFTNKFLKSIAFIEAENSATYRLSQILAILTLERPYSWGDYPFHGQICCVLQ